MKITTLLLILMGILQLLGAVVTHRPIMFALVLVLKPLVIWLNESYDDNGAEMRVG